MRLVATAIPPSTPSWISTARLPFKPHEIEKVNVYTYSIAAKLIDGKQVSTPISGKMSLPYSAAVAILRGKSRSG